MNISTSIINKRQFTKVTNECGLEVTFCDEGAAIFEIKLNEESLTRNVKNLLDYSNSDLYYGKTVGRTANRIKGNKFSLNGEIYELAANEGNNVLHGGRHGLSYRKFDVKTNCDSNKVEVIYSTLVKDLEDGYPGNLNLEIKYIVFLFNNEIDIIFSAKSDKDTVLSLTNHTYFTLGEKTCKNLTLFINSDRYLNPNGNDLIPLGIEKVTDVFDFRNPKLIGKDIESESLKAPKLNGYDHYFYFINKDINIKNASLSNSKYVMDIYTDFEGMQIYTSGFSCSAVLAPECDKIFDSIASEPSDSHLKLHLLKKDHLYSRTIKYIFSNR